MYAEFKITRRTLKLWKYESFTVDTFFVGPFRTHIDRAFVMTTLLAETRNFFIGEKFLTISWRELAWLPKGEEAVAPKMVPEAFTGYLLLQSGF